MKEFLLVFTADLKISKSSPEDMQARTKGWMDWIGSIVAQNKLKDRGNRLTPEGKVLKSKDLITDGHYLEIKESKSLFGPAVKFLKEGMNVIVSFESEEPIMAQAPNSVELEITYAEPAVKGDTSSGALKYATTENGIEIKVPLFVNQGDKVKVDTRTGEYLERVK